MYNRRIIIIININNNIYVTWRLEKKKERGHFRPFIAIGQSVIVEIITYYSIATMRKYRIRINKKLVMS